MTKSERITSICAGFSLLLPAMGILMLWGAWLTGRNYRPPFPAGDQIKPFKDSSLEDAAALGLGMRRLAADISFIRLLQYYGPAENIDYEKEFSKDTRWIPEYPEQDWEHSGTYVQILPRSLHMLDLDPYFRYGCLYSAGVLAFNLKRHSEAVQVIMEAKKYEPKEWKYDSYLAAIAYSGINNMEKVAVYLGDIIKDPEAPVIIKQQTAFLNKKLKRYKDAAAIYRDIIETSRDPAYIANAKKELEKLSPLLK